MVEPPNTSSPAANHQTSVSFREGLLYWLRLGFINFGGPAGQIALMHRDLVDRRRWISEERFLHALNYCMLLPGPEAQQLAIYIGWLLHRVPGGIVAGVFFVVPSVFVLLGLSYIYAAYGNVPAVSAVLAGFKPVVVAIVVEAILKIGRRAIKRRAHAAVAAGAFIAIYFFDAPFPLIVVAAGLVGLAGARFWPAELAVNSTTDRSIVQPSSKEATTTGSPIIDDHTAAPAYTHPSIGRAIKILVLGFALWILPLIAITLWRGWDSLHVREYHFFTLAALVTFGGAYAVLAYVTQAAVESYGWITHAEAVDGLALAETTPGPLIMVLQFIGFMAGWNNAGDMNQTASAVLGALVTTYTTFLPSFLFIFLGAPYIEVLRRRKSLTVALSGVTAAVVGVVLNLAVIFGLAVIWPRGLRGGTEWFAAAMTIASFVALYRFKIDVLWVILAGGLIGLVRVLLTS